jgi:hypothetical protein
VQGEPCKISGNLDQRSAKKNTIVISIAAKFVEGDELNVVLNATRLLKLYTTIDLISSSPCLKSGLHSKVIYTELHTHVALGLMSARAKISGVVGDLLCLSPHVHV